MSSKSLPRTRPSPGPAGPSCITKPKAQVKVLSAKKCQAIITKLHAAGELPSSLQLLLRRLGRGLAAKGKLHITEEAGTSILGKAVRGVEKVLEAQRGEARAVVEGAEAEKEARASAQASAESNLCNLRQAVVDKKAVLADSVQAIEEQKAAVQAARSAQRSAEVEVKGVESRKRQLEVVEKESYEPLKDSGSAGASGQKRMATLRKFGRDYGFHKELLTVMPAILQKQPDKRRTFDGLCMQQLEVEFARQANSLDVAVRNSEMVVERRTDELQVAQEALQEARERQRANLKELAAAEAAFEAGKKSIAEARRHARRLPADMKLAERKLMLAEARMDKFRKGPLAAYQAALPPQEVQVSGSPAEFADPELCEHSTEEEMEDEEEQEGQPEG